MSGATSLKTQSGTQLSERPLTDLSNAFAKVPHFELKFKNVNFGVVGCLLLFDYISKRKQFCESGRHLRNCSSKTRLQFLGSLGFSSWPATFLHFDN